MHRDFSFGIIPFHIPSKTFLVIQHTKDHWSFPKGHPEDKETPIEAAKRELLEETGLTVSKVSERSFIETYTFNKHQQSIFKTVTYFIGFIDSTDVTLQDDEVKDYAWLPYEEALERITFDNAQYVLKEAHAFLRIQGYFPDQF